jgi:hypothetical protein
MKESALVGDLFEGTEIKITSDGDDAANHSGGRDLYPTVVMAVAVNLDYRSLFCLALARQALWVTDPSHRPVATECTRRRW